MRIAIVALSLLIAGGSIALACTSTTIFGPNGRITWCQTCCTQFGGCTTTCF